MVTVCVWNKIRITCVRKYWTTLFRLLAISQLKHELNKYNWFTIWSICVLFWREYGFQIIHRYHNLDANMQRASYYSISITEDSSVHNFPMRELCYLHIVHSLWYCWIIRNPISSWKLNLNEYSYFIKFLTEVSQGGKIKLFSSLWNHSLLFHFENISLPWSLKNHCWTIPLIIYVQILPFFNYCLCMCVCNSITFDRFLFYCCSFLPPTQSRFCSNLSLPPKVQRAATHIARKADELDLVSG